MIRKTAKGTVGSAVLGILAWLFSAWALAVVNLPGRVSLWIVAGFFALFAFLNLAFGPTCVSYIKTPVQTEQLASWQRLRKARAGVELIRSRILEAQGAFFPEELKAELAARMGGRSPAPPPGTP
jgi:hypothetical protein